MRIFIRLQKFHSNILLRILPSAILKIKKNTIIAIEKSLTVDEITVAAHNQDAKILENTFAYDAIAVIANKSFKDSVFVVENTVSHLTKATASSKTGF